MKINLPFDSDLKVILELLNYNARLVGGCIRDYLLYNILVDDIDIATPLRPEEVINLLKDNFNVIPTGLKHGTVTVVGLRKYEITTLRSDLITNGRHAFVEFQTSYEEDAKRRDFTINALYCDYDGNLFDYFNGLEDLKHKRVRFIGNAFDRINQDYLRILRFFRFFIRFGSFNESDLLICYKLKDSLRSLSKERVTNEWFNIMKGEYFQKYFSKLIPILEVLNFINLKIDLCKFHGLSPLGLTALFYNEDIFMRFSNIQKKYILNLKKIHMDSQASANFIFNKYGEVFFNDKQILDECNFEKKIIPEMPVTGNDLIKLGNYGSDIGIILKELEKIWYEKFPIGKNELMNFIVSVKRN